MIQREAESPTTILNWNVFDYFKRPRNIRNQCLFWSSNPKKVKNLTRKKNFAWKPVWGTINLLLFYSIKIILGPVSKILLSLGSPNPFFYAFCVCSSWEQYAALCEFIQKNLKSEFSLKRTIKEDLWMMLKTQNENRSDKVKFKTLNL